MQEAGARRLERSGPTNTTIRRLTHGSLLAGLVAAAGLRFRALSPTGAAAAAAVGSAVHAGTGVRGSAAMVAFFATSSALGRLPGAGGAAQRRGSRRDAVQVVANGGPPALFATWRLLQPGQPSDWLTTAYLGSVAAATADTWATELGTRWGGTPRHLLTGRKAETGVSGAISGVGLAASVAGSVLIATLCPGSVAHGQIGAVACAAGGLIGSLTDSFLGELVQERRWCPECKAATEAHVHSCGTPTIHLAGIRGLTNDVVNTLAVSSGGLAAAGTSIILAKLTDRNGSRVEFHATSTSSRSPCRITAP